MLKVENLRKTYKTGNNSYLVLKDLSFQVKKGEFVAVMGPSGSGKTTLLNCISCFIPHDQGKILLNGKDLSGLGQKELAKVRNQHLGFVFQAAERMTVQNPVAVALEIGAERMCFFRVASSPRADIVSGIRRQFRFFQIVLIFQFPYHGTPLHPVLICSGIFQRTQKTDFRADSVPPLFRFLLPWKPAVRTAPACIP